MNKSSKEDCGSIFGLCIHSHPVNLGISPVKGEEGYLFLFKNKTVYIFDRI